ncbi:MAG: hypothetical protein NC821_03375, partial [Candidatus Omnitrophica bacterium]|nr:hypothetical protein [Candidatus Omnitrophota bacterium]
MGKTYNYSNFRITSLLSSLLSGKSDLRFDYTPSLYSLYRAGVLSGKALSVFKLSNFNQLENFFHQIGKKPIIVEFRTGEYLELTGFERGGFLWLTKFARLDERGNNFRMSEAEFSQLWSGYILGIQAPSSFQPLTNFEIYSWENKGFIFEKLSNKAQELLKNPYQPPEIVPIPVLDPPLDGRPESVGLV